MTAPPMRPPIIRPLAPSRPVTDSIEAPSRATSQTTSMPSTVRSNARERSMSLTPMQTWEKFPISSGATAPVVVVGAASAMASSPRVG